MPRGTRTPDRSTLHIADLKKPGRVSSRLMNVRLPTTVADAIDRLAKDLGATKTDVVTALLNAGLDIAAKKRGR